MTIVILTIVNIPVWAGASEESADLMLLEANPLENIRNTRGIEAVEVGGKRPVSVTSARYCRESKQSRTGAA